MIFSDHVTLIFYESVLFVNSMKKMKCPLSKGLRKGVEMWRTYLVEYQIERSGS